jgi:cell wall-associated NlpC family hydrolase
VVILPEVPGRRSSVAFRFGGVLGISPSHMRSDQMNRLRHRAAALAALVAVAAASMAIATHDSSSPAREGPRAGEHAARAPAQRPHKRLTPLQRARLRAVAWARARRGMHEVGTTNCSPAINRWMSHMGLPVPAAPPCRPWCGAFVHEAFYQAGIDLSDRVIDPNQSYWDAMQRQNGLKRIAKSGARPGDLVFFALHGTNVATHEEIVLARPRDGKVLTAGGNVGHHAVVTRRGLAYIVLAARVTATPRWSRAAARPAQGSSGAPARDA